jgi:hypothetical protein
MERLLVAHLEAGGCAAELLINGMPALALGVGGGSAWVAVHEYTLTGRNQLSITINPGIAGQMPPSQPRVAIGATWARARLVLARQGSSPADPAARVLAAVEWATPEGKSYESPTSVQRDVELQVQFPRWRWLDAPPIAINAAVQRQVLEFVQSLAVELGQGNPEPLLTASKLRFDELALAYQYPAAEGVQRFREHVQRLYAAKALKIVPPTAEGLVLRPLLEGRLIDCLAPPALPVLRTSNESPEVGNHAWPLRLAMVEGRIYVLR